MDGGDFLPRRSAADLGLAGSSGLLGIRHASLWYRWTEPDAITIRFAGGASFFSIGVVDLGERGFTVQAYDAGNVLLGSSTRLGPDLAVGYYDVVSVAFAGIASVRLFQAIDSDSTEGVVLDNMTVAPVPEPQPAALLLAGLGLLGWRQRRPIRTGAIPRQARPAPGDGCV
ncbi:hypothetical protein CLD22_16855 [Rubrivivax gelatinosus]|nr:hypothetical protein [Rubrivivax gelatinosus]